MLLNCHTCYSYKYGTIPIETLLKKAVENHFKSIVLTDINNTSATLDFVRLAPNYHIKPVVGIDFRNGVEQKYIGIAQNNEGFKELNAHLSRHLHNDQPFGTAAPDFTNVYVIYPFQKTKRLLKENEFIGVRMEDLNYLPFSVWKDSKKLVLLHPVSFSDKKSYNAHRLLRAIDNNILLSQLSKTEEALPTEIMLSSHQLRRSFEQYPTIISNTENIIADCSIDFEFGTSKNKKIFLHSQAEDWNLLIKKCEEGLKNRYANPSTNVRDRLNKELHFIKKLDFGAYFLINWDLINHARNKGYYYVGRGSGANSIVAYLLGITDVDPIELDLYFERFINPSRKNPPDFDIDFSSKDRNEMTQYLFDRHGYENVALVGNYNTFQFRSVIRELGKVFGLPKGEIDKIQSSKNVAELDDISRLVVKYSKYLHGLPSHMSVHASGIVISDESLLNYTATTIPPKGFQTTQFSMLEAEDIGLAKFDILGQRGLGKIKDALAVIAKNKGVKVNVRNVEKLKADKKVKALIKSGNAVGCFYVESPAMRNLLKKLRADDYLGLVAASSIIRPGVAHSGMMNEYILRFRIPERRMKVQKEQPELYEILEETYGVMVYQEDVIKVAHIFAGLTLEEADVLRRGMSGKYRSRAEFIKVKETFFSNCRNKKYSLSLAHEVWKQIESFAGYAFPKGHSASYAVESFQALYLKAYYPLEYMVATINNGGGFFSRELYLHEAKLHGAIVHHPCINKSEIKTTIKGNDIYLGLGMINGIDSETILEIVLNRQKEGTFLSLQNFVNRISISLIQLRSLIRIECFKFTGVSNKELLWNAHFLLGKNKKTNIVPSLFNTEVKAYEIPNLHHHPLEAAYTEMELLNFSLSSSPFELVENLPNIKTTASSLQYYTGKHIEIVGYLVHRKNTTTKGGKAMSFGTFLDLEGEWLDTVQFPPIHDKYPFTGYGCYHIKGKVINEFDVIMVETTALKRLNRITLIE